MSSAARGKFRGSVSCLSGCGTTRTPKCLSDACFVTLGMKFAELAKSERKFRARSVYQGKNICSRSGRSVYEIFDEVSNSPSSLTAARTAMAVGMSRGKRASYRDASNAYSQALIDVEPGVINLVELPRSWWPLPLVYALPGHPKSGNVWEEHAESILAKLGWRKVADWTGVFVHADMSVICLYVDDFMMVATDELERRHWAEIGKHIEFKEDAALLSRYLGGQLQYRQVLIGGAEACPTNPCVNDKLLACACGTFSGRPSGHKAVSSASSISAGGTVV